jgi:large subunit ribosomal protein L24
MNLRRGDTVVVIAGKEKGKKGKVLRLVTKKHRVVIERVAMVKKHTKPTQANPKGGIFEKEAAVPLSSVSLWCNKCGAPRRSRADMPAAGEEGKQKRRVCVKCGTAFESA